MNIYPPFIVDSKTSEAERLVFKYVRISELSDEYSAYHSLLIPRHTRNLVGQNDFAILTPHGLLILEVKGGVISTENGFWFTTTKGGVKKKLKESPFSQAEGNMFSIKRDLEDSGLPFQYRRNLLGYGVLFPECLFEATGLEIEPQLIFDAKNLKDQDAFAIYVHRLEKYWSSKLKHRSKEFLPEERRRIKYWLRPRYHSVKSLAAEFIEIKDRMVTLLDDQIDFLRTAKGKSRIICRGGAGTGKTLLGLEYARLFGGAEADERTAFLVPGEILKQYIFKGKGEHVETLSFSDFVSADSASFDLVVIDEAQDLISFELLEQLDRVLIGGLKEGRWLVLLDNENQAGIDNIFDPDSYDLLDELAEANIYLPRNIRNTLEIIDSVQQFTGRNVGRKGTGHGPKIKFIQYKDSAEAGEKAYSYIQEMLSQDLSAGQIMVLGKKTRSDSPVASALKQNGCELKPITEENIREYPFNVIGYSAIRNFKGLESYAVIIDFGEFNPSELGEDLCYVAMTRAVAQLVIMYPQSMKKELAKLQFKNMKDGES